MTNAIGRAAAAAILAALFGAAWAALFYAWHPGHRRSSSIATCRETSSGIYPPERDEASGLTFAWTGPDVVLRLPGLDRRAGLDARPARARRPRRCRPTIPTSAILADGVVRDDGANDGGLPGRARDDSGARRPPRTVTRPAQLDDLRARARRIRGALGVMLDRLSLTPDRHRRSCRGRP